ncbi:14230_t:CDS:2, partial [Gigaspora rosea]
CVIKIGSRHIPDPNIALINSSNRVIFRFISDLIELVKYQIPDSSYNVKDSFISFDMNLEMTRFKPLISAISGLKKLRNLPDMLYFNQ